MGKTKKSVRDSDPLGRHYGAVYEVGRERSEPGNP